MSGSASTRRRSPLTVKAYWGIDPSHRFLREERANGPEVWPRVGRGVAAEEGDRRRRERFAGPKRSRSARELEQGFELAELDRLDEVMVEAGLARPLPVTVLAVAAQGHDQR